MGEQTRAQNKFVKDFDVEIQIRQAKTHLLSGWVGERWRMLLRLSGKQLKGGGELKVTIFV